MVNSESPPPPPPSPRPGVVVFAGWGASLWRSAPLGYPHVRADNRAASSSYRTDILSSYRNRGKVPPGRLTPVTSS